jgi:hypothetical protein
MTNWQKVIAAGGSMLLMLAMDLLKVNDPELRYACLAVVSLVVTGHVAINLPTVKVGS